MKIFFGRLVAAMVAVVMVVGYVSVIEVRAEAESDSNYLYDEYYSPIPIKDYTMPSRNRDAWQLLHLSCEVLHATAANWMQHVFPSERLTNIVDLYRSIDSAEFLQRFEE